MFFKFLHNVHSNILVLLEMAEPCILHYHDYEEIDDTNNITILSIFSRTRTNEGRGMTKRVTPSVCLPAGDDAVACWSGVVPCVVKAFGKDAMERQAPGHQLS